MTMAIPPRPVPTAAPVPVEDAEAAETGASSDVLSTLFAGLMIAFAPGAPTSEDVDGSATLASAAAPSANAQLVAQTAAASIPSEVAASVELDTAVPVLAGAPIATDETAATTIAAQTPSSEVVVTASTRGIDRFPHRDGRVRADATVTPGDDVKADQGLHLGQAPREGGLAFGRTEHDGGLAFGRQRQQPTPVVTLPVDVDASGGGTVAADAGLSADAETDALAPVATLTTALTGRTDAPLTARNVSAPITTPHQPVPTIHRQLSEHLATLTSGAEGDHEITVQLRPEGLGEVRIALTIHNGRIELRLDTELRQTRELMRDAMADLRRDLETIGFDSASVDVGDLAERGSQRNERGGSKGRDDNAADNGWWADTELGTQPGVTNATPNVPRNTKRSPGVVDVHV